MQSTDHLPAQKTRKKYKHLFNISFKNYSYFIRNVSWIQIDLFLKHFDESIDYSFVECYTV